MLNWVAENLGTIVTALVLVAVVAAVIVKILKDKKAGKSGCGCNCAGCAFKDSCHKK